MDQELLVLHVFDKELVITGWKIIGYIGLTMFTSRWLVQMWYSKKAGKPVMPRIFWVMSMVGSLMCLLYFIFGKNDSVGILQNLFPTTVATYNLILDIKNHKTEKILAEMEKSKE